MAETDTERHFQVTVERIDDRCVVVFRGELDLHAAGDLGRAIDQVRDAGQPVVIDFAETTFMDSAGIKLLLEAYVAEGRAPQAVTLRCPSDAVTRVLELTGIGDVFRIDRPG